MRVFVCMAAAAAAGGWLKQGKSVCVAHALQCVVIASTQSVF